MILKVFNIIFSITVIANSHIQLGLDIAHLSSTSDTVCANTVR